MTSDQTDYYRMRATEEREAALRASQRNIAAIHLELARLYDALVDQPKLRPTGWAPGEPRGRLARRRG